jgi:hypothetical protein
VTQFESQGGYSKFIIVYNTVGQKIWYGNKSDQFILTNEIQLIKDALTDNSTCNFRLNTGNTVLPEYESWGLPGYLGLARCNTPAITIVNPLSGEPFSPRFYYGDYKSLLCNYHMVKKDFHVIYWYFIRNAKNIDYKLAIDAARQCYIALLCGYFTIDDKDIITDLENLVGMKPILKNPTINA